MAGQPEDEPERGRGDRVEGDASSAPRARRTARAPARPRTSRRANPSPARGPRRRTAPAGTGGAEHGRAARGASSSSVRPGVDERPKEAGVGISVPAEPLRGLHDRAAQHDGLAVVERMRERKRRLDPLEAVILERNRPEERRGGGHRMDRRAEVVDEPGERQLARAEAAADLLGRLANEHRAAGPGELDRGGEAVRGRSRRRRRRVRSCPHPSVFGESVGEEREARSRGPLVSNRGTGVS